MEEKINIAVVGAGYWGTKLIREYYLLSKQKGPINIYGVCDISRDRIEKAIKAAEVNISDLKLLSTKFSDILSDENIDAVHIATPNETHYELALRAIQAGKHVLLEKPMTTSSREAFKLVREAEKHGVTLMVDHIFRFNNALKIVRDKITNGEIGNVYYLRLNWSAYLETLPTSDIIFDLAPHPIDIINYLLEEWPLRVQGTGKSYVRENSEEVAFLTLEYPDKVMAQVELSWLYKGIKTRSVEIVGGKGVIIVDALRQKITLYKGEERVVHVPVEPNNTIRDMILHFAHHVLKNEPPLNSAHIGAMTVLVLENILKSVRSSEKVEIMR